MKAVIANPIKPLLKNLLTGSDRLFIKVSNEVSAKLSAKSSRNS